MKRHLKFLIVDDDEGICRTLTDVIEEKGHEVASVSTGEEAIEKAKKEKYSVALVDLRLPGMHGRDVIAKIKELSPQTNCIVITGYPEEEPESLVGKGASGFVMKPVNLDKLLELIKKMD